MAKERDERDDDRVGNRADYVLGTREGWDAFKVVRWHGVEELSTPFRYEITTMRPIAGGPVDIDGLVDSGATFRVATRPRWRAVHAIIAEAEELDRTATIVLHRFVLVPHIWRARFRTRCRNFVDKTLQEIVTAVLENRSPKYPRGNAGLLALPGAPNAPQREPDFGPFSEPSAFYRWAVADTSRITDRAVYPYVAQYNESDLAFLSRLLEHEGLTYYFEHAEDGLVLTISDRPGQSPLFSEDELFELRGVSKTTHRAEEVIRSFRQPRRLQTSAVTMRDHDWRRHHIRLESSASDGSGDDDVLGHYEFPAGDEGVAAKPTEYPAKVQLERFQTERALTAGIGTLRRLEPGRRFTVRDPSGARSDASHLAVRSETYATELAPEGTLLDEEPFGFAQTTGAPRPGFDNRFNALPESQNYRPQNRTSKPRIHGLQTAVVTSEEFSDGGRPEIDADQNGCVRIRFPWDQHDDTKDSSPTSNWVRVSQYWAGAGYGAQYTPRVGHEVLVAYIHGDPDQPVIVGRLYNSKNRPPLDPSGEDKTKSTLKSDSSVDKDPAEDSAAHTRGFNELRFEDRYQKEEIFLHAQRNLDEVVLADHSTSVGHDQSNTVQNDQSNEVFANRSHTVHGVESVDVMGDRFTNFESNESKHVGIDQTNVIDANQSTWVGANQTTEVVANQTFTVGGNQTTVVHGWQANVVDDFQTNGVGSYRVHAVGSYELNSIGAMRATWVSADDKLWVGGSREVVVGGTQAFTTFGDYSCKAPNIYFSAKSDYQVSSTTAEFFLGASLDVNANGCQLHMSSGYLHLDNGAGASIAMMGGLIIIRAAAVLVEAGALLKLHSDAHVSADAGASFVLHAGAVLAETAPIITLNG